ncbi:glycoside hydrolase family 76 protein [Xylariomycetidae sp. FL0641]|nr:glycoside hydrolase family 76 protein [Xylariomycetidae sp. FL0641]
MKPFMKAVAAVALATACTALEVNTTLDSSIKNAASQIAKGLYAYHNPSATTGQFDQPKPWYWWLSGSGWNGLLDYTILTNDTKYTSDLMAALADNLGPNFDFVPPAQANWEANDDQVYWVYNALTAMEQKFPTLPCQASPNGNTSTTVTNSSRCANDWEAISMHAFEDFATRWALDATTCNGGLKWQYTPANNGWTYKNAVTNGGFFQTAARLARHTRNATYAAWAERVWDWSAGVGLVDAGFRVRDGAGDADGANCSQVNPAQYSYNAAAYLHGAAHLYAYYHQTSNSNNSSSSQGVWESRVRGLLDAAKQDFFTGDGVMYELCERDTSCTTDQTSFKASLARWMASTAVLVPSTREDIAALLRTSARGAALGCGEGRGGNATCGMQWTTGGFDGQADFGTQVSALAVVLALMALKAPAPGVVW